MFQSLVNILFSKIMSIITVSAQGNGHS